MKFLEVLNSLMRENYLNKHSLSIGCGVPYNTIDSFYTKGCHNVKLTTLMKIADFFGVTLDYLIYGESFRVNEHEKKVVEAYRNHPEMQDAVDRLLLIPKKEN